MPSQYRSELERCVSKYAGAPLMVHSNLFWANMFVERHTNRRRLLEAHGEMLQELIQPTNLWIPVFTYQFPKTSSFDVENSKSELGPFTEYMRTEWATERSLDPIFSFASLKPILEERQVGDQLFAFGDQTPFSELVRRRGAILFYGADISSMTFIHFVESRSGNLVYRYDKVFDGMIVDKNGKCRKIRYVYHVRPRDKYIEYDWSRIKRDLHAVGVLSTVSKGNVDLATCVPADELAHYLLDRIRADPFYLLNEKSRSWVEPFVNRLGRRLQVDDFEEQKNE